jgi:peptide/nickel transport system substrate-binding protein
MMTRLAALALCALVAAESTAKSIWVAVNTWPPVMGNPYAQQIQGAVHPFVGMFDALTFMDQNGATLPRLALSWQADSPTQWTFKLRPGVAFTNGEPFDAAAVVAMIEMLKSPEGQRFFYATEVANIVSAKRIDDLTVALLTEKPDAILPKRLSMLSLTPPRYWREVGADGFTQRPVGTGPFTLLSWGRDKGCYDLKAEATSWRPSRHLTRIEFRILQEVPRRVQALETGEIDLAFNIGFEDMAPLKGQGFSIVVNQIPTALSIALSNKRPDSPLADVRVRQAMNMAVDRDRIAKTLLLDTVKPTSHGIEPGVFGYNPGIKSYPYDPARAKALLAEAGHGDGFALDAAVLAIATTDGAAILQQVAQDLAAVGIGLRLRSVLGTEWVQMWTSGDWKGADVLSANWNGAT